MRRPKILIQSNRNMEIESKLEQKTTSGLANGSEKSIKKSHGADVYARKRRYRV